MKITKLHAWLQRIPLAKPYTIAYKTITDTEIVFFEITLENGITGIGAANPFEEVVGETPAATLHNLQSDFVQQLVGSNICHFNKIISNATAHFVHLPGTQAAIDIALHDAFGKYLGIPVLDFYGQQIEALPTSVTIGIKDTADMMLEAKEYQQLGFKILKIKTGLDVAQDIDRVRQLTEKFAGTMRIRVDANQGYSLPQLQQFIQATHQLGIELIEQPMPVGEEQQLQTLADAHKKLLVADESLLDAGSAMALSQPPQPYGVFNIKLMKCGGIKGALEIAHIAQHAGINLFWGCNDESIISITAALHAAYACANTRYLDLDGSFDIIEKLVTGGFTLKDGMMYPCPLPGLGVQQQQQQFADS